MSFDRPLPFTVDAPGRRVVSMVLLHLLDLLRREGAFYALELRPIGPELARGAEGPWVERWQSELVGAGLSIGRAGVDGKFGPATEAATMQWVGSSSVTAEHWDALLASERFTIGADTLGEGGDPNLDLLQFLIDEAKGQPS